MLCGGPRGIGIATPECVRKTGVRVPECRRFERRCLDPTDRRGPHPRRREPDAGPIASYRSGGRRRGPRNRGFTVAAEAADTVREGHAEAGHDQSGNVGGRESTVPRFENPNRPARQAVPPLRQARRVLHALYLEAAGQPGTAPRPLLPVPPRGARRFAELPRPRLVGRTTAFLARNHRRAGCHECLPGGRIAVRVQRKSGRPRWSSSATPAFDEGAMLAGQSADLVGRDGVHRAGRLRPDRGAG